MSVRKFLKVVFVMMIVSFAALLSGCDKDDFAVVVSDGITNTGFADDPDDPDEILPNATVFHIKDKDEASLLKFVTAEKVEGVEIRFFARPLGTEDAWFRLGNPDSPLFTDSDGRVRLPAIRKWLPDSVIGSAPMDLQLTARAYHGDEYVEDDLGMIRVLDEQGANNPEAVVADHDNTLHRTGGANSVLDWIEFVNWMGSDWPLIDGFVVDAVKGLMDSGRDLLVVSGLPADLRHLCRTQMINHFEKNGKRRIPIVVKKDLDFEHGNDFKADALRIISGLYGEGKLAAMVGDTAREDGYGALANDVTYIPFQIDYYLDPGLLDTEGYGEIEISDISWDWLDVVNRINGIDTGANFFMQDHERVLNIAHRGGGDLAPENTLTAYETALSAGADVLEMDVHLTADGHVVVSHDGTVDRCTDGSGPISAFSLEDLKELNAGYNFTPDGVTYPYREEGTALEIPTLGEVFDAYQGRDVFFVLEIKPENNIEITEKVLDLIQEFDMEDRIVMGAFNKESLDAARIRSAVRGMNLLTSFATEEVIEFLALPDGVLDLNKHRPKGAILQIPLAEIPLIPPLIMDKARELDLKVQVWTVNDPGDMEWLINDLKVDGIMTDNPAVLEALLN
ncbi:MAG: glycerophosphodiester phosphodiesterase [Desulfobacteraceae bacterium]|nr:glycerophosphodiester phosphodiesterase [Desulfobacteraceae bacterium]